MSRKYDHKHTYDNKCLLHDINMDTYFLSSYCIICGKIGIISKDSELVEGHKWYRMLSDEELLEKYKDLEIIDVDIFKDKFINREG